MVLVRGVDVAVGVLVGERMRGGVAAVGVLEEALARGDAEVGQRRQGVEPEGKDED